MAKYRIIKEEGLLEDRFYIYSFLESAGIWSTNRKQHFPSFKKAYNFLYDIPEAQEVLWEGQL